VFMVRITTTQVELHKIVAAPAAPSSTNFTYALYPTLQELIDKINATTTASTGGQWRGQLMPGVDPSTPSSNLCVTTIDDAGASFGNAAGFITSTIVANVPVGAVISGSANLPANATVLSKSGTSLNLCDSNGTASVTTGVFGPGTLTFDCANTGDQGFVTGATRGYMRAWNPTIPVFMYLKRSALPGYDRPDRQSVYYTIASPGAASSGSSMAPNAWSLWNRQTALGRFGNIQGFADIEGQAIVFYERSVKSFINTRTQNTAEDFDYRLVTIDDLDGCIAWDSIVAGRGWAGYMSKQGYKVVDANRQPRIISNAIHNPTTLLGDLSAEIASSSDSTHKDTDDAQFHASILGSQLHLSLRSNGASTGTYPDRKFIYDFGPGEQAYGLAELFRPEGGPYGWSSPLTNLKISQAIEIASATGIARYGMQESNAGTAACSSSTSRRVDTTTGRPTRSWLMGLPFSLTRIRG
jgi:hypothetical protein